MSSHKVPGNRVMTSRPGVITGRRRVNCGALQECLLDGRDKGFIQ